MDENDINAKSVDPTQFRTQIGMVFQKSNTVPKSIYDNVVYGSRIDGLCSALDLIASAQVDDSIDELRKEYAVVIVTHSMQQAARISQKTAFFHLGNLVQFNDTSDIFTNPKDPRTERYIPGRIG